MAEYKVKRKVLRVGSRKKGSLVVVLPKIWTRAHSVHQGDDVIIAFNDYKFLKVLPVRNSDTSE